MSLKYVIFLIAFILCFANLFETFVGLFQYVDEFIALLMVAVIFMYAIKRAVPKDLFIMKHTKGDGNCVVCYGLFIWNNSYCQYCNGQLYDKWCKNVYYLIENCRGRHSTEK